MKETLVAIVLFGACVGAFGDLVGGLRDVDLNNKDASVALEYVVHKHNLKNNYLATVAEVLSAQKQVVAGMLYTFTVIMERTTCSKDSVNVACSRPQAYKCTFTLWSRPWMESPDMQKIVTENCTD
ncbi:unnamed protein product [Knipowitschia caucasica]|uniref:Cystatin domain-containing protein n=1 Tax=Knipowitschia caucasica TaxID=637954 RepID=A0AAV2JNC1_KNICA